MAEAEIVYLTNMCMVYDGDMVLVQNRVDPNWSGIVFPGGHVELGESFADSVVREVWEETGLKINCPELCGVKNWVMDDKKRYIVFLYKTNQFSGELRGSREGDVFWVKREDVYKMKMPVGFEPMLKIFFEDSADEFFYYRENGEMKCEYR